MIKKFIILGSIVFLCEDGFADMRYTHLRDEQCSNTISHQLGQHWKADPAWTVIQEQLDSTLTYFSPNTKILRKVAPYHIGHNLADVTCSYQDSNGQDILVLKRTYPETANANYILA